MSRADVTFLIDYEDEDDRYSALNALPVSYEEFATVASLYGRAYGLLEGDNQRGMTGPNGELLESFVVNRCLRAALYRSLYRVGQELEEFLGYKLSPRYLSESFFWKGTVRLALTIPGIEQLEVKDNWYEYDPKESFEIDFYTQRKIKLFTDDNVIIARVSAVLFPNPRHAMLRNEDNSEQLLIPDRGHKRYSEYDSASDEWLIPLTTNKSSVAITDTVHAQHRFSVRVTVVTPELGALPGGGVSKPVYPGSNQIVPHRILESDEQVTTYEFDAFTLIAPAFVNETVNWEDFETYKLYDLLELRYVVEEPAYLKLIWTEGDEQTTYQFDPTLPTTPELPRLEAVLTDPDQGFVHLYANGALVTDLTPWWWKVCGTTRRKVPEALRVELAYRVHPRFLSPKFRSQIERAKEAIISKVAAELPMTECGCLLSAGFIAEQQLPYADAFMNPFTGVEIVKTRHNQRHGQVHYRAIRDELQIHRRVYRAGKVV